MEPDRQDPAERRDPRLTRRAALAAGAGVYGGLLLGASASARSLTPAQLLARLRGEVRRSSVGKGLKARLLNIIGEAGTDLRRGRNMAARNALNKHLIPLIQNNAGHHGLSVGQARTWVADVRRIVARIPRGDLGAPNAFGVVYIFNLSGDTVTIADLNGQGPTGSPIPPPVAYSSPRWAPQETSVARTNLTLDQLVQPLFVNQHQDNEVNSLTLNLLGQAWKGRVAIPNPPAPRLETDLWLYVAYAQAFLFESNTGAIIGQPGGNSIPFTPA